MRRLPLFVFACLLTTTASFAQSAKVAPSASMAADAGMAPMMGPGGEDDDEEPPPPSGKRASGRRTPAQMTLRKEIWERNEKAIETKVHQGGARLNDDEREVIKTHWLRLARLMRLRELAQEDNNDAAVKRVDAALAKEEKSVDTKLEKLVPKMKGGAK